MIDAVDGPITSPIPNAMVTTPAKTWIYGESGVVRRDNEHPESAGDQT